jgi:acyl-CoA reductase-like NAD-dependent aldehyde dehydrogenase
MNKLMMLMRGFAPLMDEAGDEGGGNPPANGEGEGEATPAIANPEGGGNPPANGEGEGEATPAIANPEGGGNPPANGEGEGEGAEESAEDIERAITDADNDFKGKWDAEQVKEMAPLLKELGVSGEKASKLAVKLAEVQTRQMQAAELKFRQEQSQRIKAANAENAKRFSKTDFKQIDAGIQKFTRADGPLRKLLYTTELGTDAEVLKIFHALGEAAGVKETSAPAAAGAAGNSEGWAESFEK